MVWSSHLLYLRYHLSSSTNYISRQADNISLWSPHYKSETLKGMQEQPHFMGSLPKSKQLKIWIPLTPHPELIVSSSTSYLMVSSSIHGIAIAHTCPVRKFAVLLLTRDIFYIYNSAEDEALWTLIRHADIFIVKIWESENVKVWCLIWTDALSSSPSSTEKERNTFRMIHVRLK